MSIFCRLVFVIFFAQKFEYSVSFDIIFELYMMHFVCFFSWKKKMIYEVSKTREMRCIPIGL